MTLQTLDQYIETKKCGCSCHNFETHSICCSCDCDIDILTANPPNCVQIESLLTDNDNGDAV